MKSPISSVAFVDRVGGQVVYVSAAGFFEDSSVGIPLQPEEISAVTANGATPLDLSDADEDRLCQRAVEVYEEENRK